MNYSEYFKDKHTKWTLLIVITMGTVYSFKWVGNRKYSNSNFTFITWDGNPVSWLLTDEVVMVESRNESSGMQLQWIICVPHHMQKR